MATTLIVNFGPQAVKVEVQGRDTQGQYLAKGEKIIPAGKSRYVTVDEASSIQLIEVPDELDAND